MKRMFRKGYPCGHGMNWKVGHVMEFSKRLIADIRALLWVVTVGGLLLAAYRIRVGYTGALPSSPWALACAPPCCTVTA